MLWVYELSGLDLAEWAHRAPAELAATAGPGDRVLMLVEDEAASAGLLAALRDAGYAAERTQVEGRPGLQLQVEERTALAAEPSAQ